MGARSARVIRALQRELREPWGLAVAGLTGSALFVLGAPLEVAAAAWTATLGVKLAVTAIPLRRLPKRPPPDSEAAVWLVRAEAAAKSLRELASSAAPGPVSHRTRAIGDRASATLEVMRRLAFQDMTLATLLTRFDPQRAGRERDTLERERAATTDAAVRGELERSLAALAAQTTVRANLDKARRDLNVRMRSVVFGLEGLVARLAEVLALSAGTGQLADDRISELEGELDALRTGLAETEALGQTAMRELAATYQMEVRT